MNLGQDMSALQMYCRSGLANQKSIDGLGDRFPYALRPCTAALRLSSTNQIHLELILHLLI